MKLVAPTVRCPQGAVPAEEPGPNHHRRADSRLSTTRRSDVGPRVHRRSVNEKATLRSGADRTVVQWLLRPRADSELLSLRHRVVRLCDVSGMEEPRLCAGRQTSRSTASSSQFASASCSTRCARIKSFDEFAQQCEFFLDTASDYKCDFVLFPELFTTQLLSCVEAHAARTGGTAIGRVHAAVSRVLHRDGHQVRPQRHRRIAVRRRARHALQHRPICSAAMVRSASSTRSTSRPANASGGASPRVNGRSVRHRLRARSPFRFATTSSFPN